MSDDLNKKLDQLGHAIEESQKSFERGIKDSAENASKAAAKIGEELQERDLRLKAIEEETKLIAKQMARVSGGKESAEERELLYKDEMTRYLRKGHPIDDKILKEITYSLVKKGYVGLNDEEREVMAKSLLAGNNPEGGYFIRPELSSRMITRVFETSPLRSVASVVTTNSDVLEMIIDDNQAATGGWVGEVQSRGVTDTPQIGMLRIAVHEQFAQPRATQKLLDDAGFDVEAWLSRKISDRFSRDENTAFVSGDGSQKPRGFLDYPDYTTQQKADANGAYGRGAVEQFTSGTSGQITGDGLKALQNGLKEFYQPNAVWGIRRNAFEQVITLKDNQDRYIFNTRFLQEARTLSLLGKPVIFMNDMPDAAADSLSVVYGDFREGYTIVDRLGLRILRDPYTDKPYVRFYAIKRVGGDVTNYEALKLLKLSA
jgi:HK97 family phage major capsid protein